MTWPTGDSLIASYDENSLSDRSLSMAQEWIDVATLRFNRKANPAKLPSDGSCPADVSQAIIMYARLLLASDGSGNDQLQVGEGSASKDSHLPPLLRDLERSYFRKVQLYPAVEE